MKLDVALCVWVCCGLAACGDAPGTRASAVNIDPRVTRVTVAEPVSGPVVSAGDFVFVGGQLYLLDWRERQVAKLAKRGAAWRVLRTFSRKGNGPGEVAEPVAIAFDDVSGTLGVLERSGELEVFDTSGTYVRSESFDLPCVASRVQLSFVRDLLLTGIRCTGGRFERLSTDTTYMLLAAITAHQPPHLLAVQPVATLNGDWGSIFVATWPFAIHRDSVLFGSGVDDCLFRGSLRSPRVLSRGCNGAFARYSAPEPAGFNTRGAITRASAWPEPLPLFAALTHAGGTPVLIRPIAADSAVFETLSEPARRILVSPLDGFVGCKPAGCLWYTETENGSAIRFVTAAELARLSQAALPPATQ